MRDALRLAFGTLTAYPVHPPGSLEAPVPGRAMAAAPLAGVVPGLTATLVAWAALHLGVWPPAVAALTLLAFALSTRALHLDGLADTADGFAASYDRDRALTVMRRGDSGPVGVAAVVLVLLLQFACLQQILTLAVDADAHERGGVLRAAALTLVLAVAARVAVPVVCARGVPAARPEGLGATVAGSVGPLLLGMSVAGSALFCSLLAWAAGFPWWAGALAVIVAGTTAAVIARRATTRLGGITGDVIGFAVETAAVTTLLTLAATG